MNLCYLIQIRQVFRPRKMFTKRAIIQLHKNNVSVKYRIEIIINFQDFLHIYLSSLKVPNFNILQSKDITKMFLLLLAELQALIICQFLVRFIDFQSLSLAPSLSQVQFIGVCSASMIFFSFQILLCDLLQSFLG